MIKVAVIIVAGSVAALAVPASAARLLGGTLNVDLALDTRFDSNELRQPNGVPARPGTSKSDIIYQPSASMTYTRDVGRQQVVLSTLYGRDFYQRNSFLSRDRLLLRGALNYVVGARCKGTLDASLSRRQSGTQNNLGLDPTDPDYDPGVDDASGRRIDNPQRFANYGASANCGSPSGALTFGGNLNYATLRNKAITRRFSDSNTTTVGGFLGLGILRPGQLQVVGNYSKIDYPNNIIIPGLPIPFRRSAIDTYRIGLTYSRPIGTRLTGSVGGSYLRGVPRGQGSKFSSPAYNIALTYTPGTRLTTSLSGSRDISASNSAGALYQVIDALTATAAYKASPSITGRTRVSYQRRSFKQPFATVEDVVPRSKENTTLIGGGVSYAPRSLYDVSFDVSHTFRRSNPSLYNYSNTSAVVSLAVHF